MGEEDLIMLAKDTGFTASALFDAGILIPRPEVREMCADGKCLRYDHCWSCPPACGTLKKTSAVMSRYSRGILVQTTGKLEDEFDAEGMENLSSRHKKDFSVLTRRIRILDPGCLPLCAGSCTVCAVCTYPGRPCRFPERMFSSMEAYGLLVSDVCQKAGLKYYYGPKTMTYSSCILFHPEKFQSDPNVVE